MTDALIKAGRLNTSCACQPLVFLCVHCSICVHCCIPILLIKTVHCSIPHCIFFCFVSLFFPNFCMLLILGWFVSFPILSQHLFCLLFILFKWSFTLCVYNHLMLSLFNSLILNISSCFTKTFFLFSHRGANYFYT